MYLEPRTRPLEKPPKGVLHQSTSEKPSKSLLTTLHEARISQTGSHDRVLDLGSNTLHIDVSGPVSFFLLFSYLVILINFITSFFRGKNR